MKQSDRLAMLYEVTDLMGRVLEELERREGVRSKHMRNIRLFVDTFCDEWKKENGLDQK